METRGVSAGEFESNEKLEALKIAAPPTKNSEIKNSQMCVPEGQIRPQPFFKRKIGGEQSVIEPGAADALSRLLQLGVDVGLICGANGLRVCFKFGPGFKIAKLRRPTKGKCFLRRI
jgi:hypothetical protein